MEDKTVTIMIGSPLEAEQATRIGTAYAGAIELIYRPDLLPPPRYAADHLGSPDWRRTDRQQVEWRDLLRKAEVLWDFPSGEHGRLLDIAPRLRWMQTTSAGVGQRAKRVGLHETNVIITTASGIHGQPLAEFVFAVLLAHTKQLPHLTEEKKAHHWERFCTRELAGQVLAIVGPGRIGREIARLGHAFSMTVWATARDNSPARAIELGVDRLFSRGELRTMLAGADCVVLCAPHTAETEGLIGKPELAAMKPEIVFINISRGAVVDEEALIATLRQGKIALAALDVFAAEPLPADSPLWDLPNVIINPHSASTADSENRKLTDRFIENLDFFLSGRLDRLAPVLDLSRLY